MPIFPTISNATPFRYPITRSVTQRAAVHTMCDFSEVRWTKGPAPLTEFRLVYQQLNGSDKEVLRQFYDAQGGEFGTTWSLLFENILYKTCQFIGPFEAVLVGVTTWQVTMQIRTIGTGPAGGGGIVNLPHGPVVSATLNLTSSHTPNPAFTPNFGAIASLAGIGLIFPVPSWFQDKAGYPTRTDSLTIDPVALMDGSLFVLVGLEQDGTSFGEPAVLSPPDTMNIYDCWATVVYQDTTTGTWRPTAFAESILATGQILNPGNAIDTDPTTFASLQCTAYTSFLNGIFLNLNSFNMSS